MPAPSKTSASRLIAAENRVKALDLRRRGWSYARIAQEIGVSRKRAWDYISEEMKALAELGEEKAEELVRLEMERLDELQNAIWDKAMRGDTKAIEASLKIMSRRATLKGLDQPTKVHSEQYVYDQLSTEELIQRARMQGITIPPELEKLQQRPLAIEHIQEAVVEEPNDDRETT